MQIGSFLKTILQEIEETVALIDDSQVDELEEAIRKAERIFVAGTGRALLMIRPFAMRLMQFGRDAYVVGETVTPAITEKDLLLIASGSGTTATMQVIAKRCKQIGAGLALITTMPDSPIAGEADHVVVIPAGTSKNADNAIASRQVGASTFEQCVLLLGDALIERMYANAGTSGSNASLMSRHANLE